MNAELFRRWLNREATSLAGALTRELSWQKSMRVYRERQLEALALYTASVDCELSFRYVVCVVRELRPNAEHHAMEIDVCVREALDGVHGDDIE